MVSAGGTVASLFDVFLRAQAALIAGLIKLIKSLLKAGVKREKLKAAVVDGADQVTKKVWVLAQALLAKVLRVSGYIFQPARSLPKPNNVTFEVGRKGLEKLVDGFDGDEAKFIKGLRSALEQDSAAVARKSFMDTAERAKGLTVIGSRRVIHPEKSKSGTCGRCIAAATRVYHKAHLKPVHDHCKCTVMPVYSVDDGGGFLDLGEDLNNFDGVGEAYQQLVRLAGGKDFSAFRFKEVRPGVLGLHV